MTIKIGLKILYLIVLLIFIASPCLGEKVGPLEQIKPRFDQVITIINSCVDKNKKERQVKKIAEEIIDFKEMAARVLARHKNKFTSAQLKEFIDIFTRKIKNIYFTKMYNNWTPDVHIEYSKPRISVSRGSGNKYAVIKSEIQRERGNIFVEYRLIIKPDYRDNLWRIYDISMGGISIVKHYRNKFNNILNKKGSGPSEIIKALKK